MSVFLHPEACRKDIAEDVKQAWHINREGKGIQCTTKESDMATTAAYICRTFKLLGPAANVWSNTTRSAETLALVVMELYLCRFPYLDTQHR